MQKKAAKQTKRKYKILLVHNYYQIPGGEDTVVANEKKLLEENGHTVFLYSRNNAEIKEMKSFQKLLLPVTAVFSGKTYREIRQNIRKNRIDIVHVHNTLTMVSPSVFYAAFAEKVPVVQTLHNFRMQCPNGLFFRDGKTCEDCLEKGLFCGIRYGCYRNSKVQTMVSAAAIKLHRMLGTYKKVHFICLTEFNRKKLLELNNHGKKKIVDQKKVFVKPNFSQDSAKCMPYAERKNQCVYVGRLEEIKGIRQLLTAWKQIEDIDLILCGTGPLAEWCQKFVQDNQMKNVLFKGFTKHEEVLEIIGASKALLLPSLVYEGFPMTIAESFSMGTPVIGSDFGNVGSLIEEGVTGWKIDCKNPESLVRKVRQITDLTKSSRQVYEKKYGREANYGRLMEIYDTLGRI